MLNKNNTGLVIIDVQGKLAQIMDGSETLIRNLITLTKSAQLLDLPILWLEQNPENLGETTPELRDLLLTERPPITKNTFDACGVDAFAHAIHETGRQNWLVAGIEAHVCVYQTALSLQARGHHVELVTDCLSARNPDNTALAIDKMVARGIGITSIEMAIFEMLGDCLSPEFKAFVKLIK